MSWTPSDRATSDALREIDALSVGAGTPPEAPAPIPTGYAAVTRTATYGFLAALPLFVLYEVGILLATGGTGEIRVGADVWIKTLLAGLGATGALALGVGVFAAGVAVFWSERHRRPPLVAKYFGWIVAESLLYAVVLAYIVGGVTAFLFAGGGASSGPPVAMLAQLADFGLGLQLALSIGAGLYEELVFRVLLVGGLALALGRFTPLTRPQAYLVAALVGAVIFSAVHHIGVFGDPFTMQVFTFRFLFGLALNAVFLLRGFAVAAWAHALYDVLVVTGGV